MNDFNYFLTGFLKTVSLICQIPYFSLNTRFQVSEQDLLSDVSFNNGSTVLRVLQWNMAYQSYYKGHKLPIEFQKNMLASSEIMNSR